jgi:hypothetical protein
MGHDLVVSESEDGVTQAAEGAMVEDDNGWDKRNALDVKVYVGRLRGPSVVGSKRGQIDSGTEREEGKFIHAPLASLPIVEEPFQRIAMDTVGPMPRSQSRNCYDMPLHDTIPKTSFTQVNQRRAHH